MMSWNRTYFAVETRHPVKGSRWDGQHQFRVSADERPSGRLYYAVAKDFGCGRSCRTPELAIRHLANDNGADVVKISYQHEDEV